jgi:TorA maturation chaperone TorD
VAQPGPNPAGGSANEAEAARAYAYALLGRLLTRAPDAALLARLGAITGDSGTPIGQALADLAAAARATDPVAVQREYDALFVGVTRGELVPYASFYLTGFLNEKPLAELRAEMARLGVARADNNRDPEDHAGALCELMAGLIVGAFGAPLDLATQQHIFDRHMAPWIGRFFTDLEQATAASFYRPVGRLGRIFVELEQDAFALAA